MRASRMASYIVSNPRRNVGNVFFHAYRIFSLCSFKSQKERWEQVSSCTQIYTASQFQIPEGTLGTDCRVLRRGNQPLFQIPEGTLGTHNIKSISGKKNTCWFVNVHSGATPDTAYADVNWVRGLFASGVDPRVDMHDRGSTRVPAVKESDPAHFCLSLKTLCSGTRPA